MTNSTKTHTKYSLTWAFWLDFNLTTEPEKYIFCPKAMQAWQRHMLQATGIWRLIMIFPISYVSMPGYGFDWEIYIITFSPIPI